MTESDPKEHEADPNVINTPKSFTVFTDTNNIQASEDDALFHHSKDTDSIPFHLQGDETFNRKEIVMQRQALKNTTSVSTEIDRFWETFTKAKHCGQDAVTKAEYCEAMMLISKVLRDDFVEDSVRIQVEKDWAEDNDHPEFMLYEAFRDSLFEIVDMWTLDVSEHSYAHFLRMLLSKVSVRVIVFIDGSILRVPLGESKHLNEMIVRAIPLRTVKDFRHVADAISSDPRFNTLGDLANANSEEIEPILKAYLHEHAISCDHVGAELNDFITRLSTTANADKKIETIHELAQLNPATIEDMQWEYIRQHELNPKMQFDEASIELELQKFNLDTTKMTVEEAKQKYATLYSQFFRSKGDEIVHQAQQVHQQIVAELEKVGFVCEDKDYEASYQLFHDTVVHATAEKIIAGANEWIETARTDDKVIMQYVSQITDSFMKLAEAKAGSSDSAFMALINDSDDESEEEDAPDDLEEPKKVDLGDKPDLQDAQERKERVPVEEEKPKEVIQDQAHQIDITTPKPPIDDSVIVQVLQQMLDYAVQKISSESNEQALEGLFERHSQSQEMDATTFQALGNELGAQDNNVLASAFSWILGTSNEFLLKQDFVNGIMKYATAQVFAKASNTPDPIVQNQPSEEILPTLSKTEAPTEASVEIVTPLQIEQEQDESEEEQLVSQAVEAAEVVPKDEVLHLPSITAPEPAPVEMPKALEPPALENKAIICTKEEAKSSDTPDEILLCGIEHEHLAGTARYLRLLGFNKVTTIEDESKALEAMILNANKYALICYDVGQRLDIAITKLKQLQKLVGRKIIFLGGKEDDPATTTRVSKECLSEGAVYFAVVPVDFKVLRNVMTAFFERSYGTNVGHQKKKSIIRGAADKISASKRISDGSIAMRPAQPLQQPKQQPTSILKKLRSSAFLGSKTPKAKGPLQRSRTRRSLDTLEDSVGPKSGRL